MRKKFIMEVDQDSGRMLFPADGVFKRHDLPRDEQLSIKGETTSNKAVYEENLLMSMVHDLVKKGKTPNPDMSLEDWVDDNTGGEYTRQISPLSY